MIQFNLLPITLLVCVATPAYFEEKCGQPPNLKSARILSKTEDSYNVGAAIFYTCMTGYFERSGKSQAVCELKEGAASWKEATLRCSPVSCPTPEPISHGKIIGTLFTFGNHITYECDKGYKLIFDKKMQICLATGKWSTRIPKCEAVDCGPPSKPNYGEVDYYSTKYGSGAKYSCNKDYQLSGQTTAICSDSGNWTPNAPECKEYISNCPKPQMQLPGGLVKLYDTKGTEVVEYTCNDGQTDIISFCLENGKWSSQPPICPGTTKMTPLYTTAPSVITKAATKTPVTSKPGSSTSSLKESCVVILLLLNINLLLL